jgi:hypothetical protein
VDVLDGSSANGDGGPATPALERYCDLILDVAATTNRVSGGASFPAILGTLTVSSPLAVLTMTDEGVSVNIRPKLLSRLTAKMIPSAVSATTWSVHWSNLTSVEFARRSVIFHAQGSVGCRFVAKTKKRLAPILEELENRGIALRQVKSTLRWYFRPS